MPSNHNDPVARLRAAEQRRTPGVWKRSGSAHTKTLWLDAPDGKPVIHWEGFDAAAQSWTKRASNAAYIATCTECVPALLEWLAAAEQVIRTALAYEMCFAPAVCEPQHRSILVNRYCHEYNRALNAYLQEHSPSASDEVAADLRAGLALLEGKQ